MTDSSLWANLRTIFCVTTVILKTSMYRDACEKNFVLKYFLGLAITYNYILL